LKFHRKKCIGELLLLRHASGECDRFAGAHACKLLILEGDAEWWHIFELAPYLRALLVRREDLRLPASLAWAPSVAAEY